MPGGRSAALKTIQLVIGHMRPKSHPNLKIISFEGQMLPHWSQLLDLAARFSPVPEGTRKWFSRFTNSSGVDDARTVKDQCALLQVNIQECREALWDVFPRPWQNCAK